MSGEQMVRREHRGPRTVDFTDPQYPRSGITIQHIKSKGVLYVSGWYDTYAGIGGVEVPVDEFLGALGIARPASRNGGKA